MESRAVPIKVMLVWEGCVGLNAGSVERGKWKKMVGGEARSVAEQMLLACHTAGHLVIFCASLKLLLSIVKMQCFVFLGSLILVGWICSPSLDIPIPGMP